MENSGRFTKGKSGNPGGRPRKKLIDRCLQELLLEDDSKKAAELAQKVLDLATAGDMDAIRFIAERTEGKPLQKMELSGGLEYREMTDEEVHARINQLREELRAEEVEELNDAN